MTTNNTATSLTSKLSAYAQKASIAVVACYGEVSAEVCECGAEFKARVSAFLAKREELKNSK